MHNLPRRKFLALAAALVLSIVASIPTAGGQNTEISADINARMLAQAMALGGAVNAMNDEEARRAEASAVAPVPVDRAWIHWRKEVLGK